METIHLQTSLSVDECKNRLRSSAGTSLFFPELQGEDMIAGIRGDRFWIRRSYMSIGFRFGYGTSFIPVLNARMFTEAGKTQVVGHFGISPVERAVLVVLALFAICMAAVCAANRDWGVLGVLAGWIAVLALCISRFKKTWQTDKARTQDFLMETLQAEKMPEEPIVRN